MSTTVALAVAINLAQSVKAAIKGCTGAFVSETGKLVLAFDLKHIVPGKARGSRWTNDKERKSGVRTTDCVAEKAKWLPAMFEHDGHVYTVMVTITRRPVNAPDAPEQEVDESIVL